MSSFTTPLDLRVHGVRDWEVLTQFSYSVDEVNDEIVVPAGFRTDLATVPRIFWSIFPPHGKYAKAAVIHDYMYKQALRTKREADAIFLEGMKILGVGSVKRTLMYWAVRLFGRGNYKENEM